MTYIVENYLTVDLHIHSNFSNETKVGEPEQLKNNMVDNLHILIDKLREHEVNMCAITDHNIFSYDLYKKFVEKTKNDSVIKKVLPGVEFDVQIDEKVIHIVTIFDDQDATKLEKIQENIENYFTQGKNAISENDYFSLLKDIGLNVVTIAHQKNDPENNAGENDRNLSAVGKERFNELISVSYFDAVEFANARVQGMLNSYQEQNELQNLQYITGSDCHDWQSYPHQTSNKKYKDFEFSSIKSLPTFKGLVMAITEPERIQIGEATIRQRGMEEVLITIDGREYQIPLSSGLNAIIGDNSVGKSLILESLNDSSFSSLEDDNQRRGYKQYIRDKRIEISSNSSDYQYKFDRQGSVREKFTGDRSIQDEESFKDKFPSLDVRIYKQKIENHVENIIKHWECNSSLYDEKIFIYTSEINIPCEIADERFALNIIVPQQEYKENKFQEIVNRLDSLKITLDKLYELEAFEKDGEVEKEFYALLGQLYEKYKGKLEMESSIEKARKKIYSICSEKNDKYIKNQTDRDKKLSEYRDKIDQISNAIKEYYQIEYKKSKLPQNFIEELRIDQSENQVNKYLFVTKAACEYIDEEVLLKILLSPFANGRLEGKDDKEKLKFLLKLRKTEIADKLNKTIASKKKYKDAKAIDIFKEEVNDYTNKYVLKIVPEILEIKDGTKQSTGNSSGKNAIIYFDVLAENLHTDTYIVDQPEDDVSQNKIVEELIPIMRKMSKTWQVIFVTHRPELVVNLDVDNVIVLEETKQGSIDVSNGALEFENDDYSIIEKVSQNLDGGAEVIRKRWKRYAKNKN